MVFITTFPCPEAHMEPMQSLIGTRRKQVSLWPALDGQGLSDAFDSWSDAAVGQLRLPADQTLPPARRLVVLVSSRMVDQAGLAARVLGLASPRELSILFLALAGETHEPLRVRRELATLAALTQDGRLHIETQVSLEGNWLRAVGPVWLPGDLVVCHAEEPWDGGRASLATALLGTLDSTQNNKSKCEIALFSSILCILNACFE
jgi:hypothetical protein